MSRRSIFLFPIGFIILCFLGAEYWRMVHLPWSWLWCDRIRLGWFSIIQSEKSQWIVIVAVAASLVLLRLYQSWVCRKYNNSADIKILTRTRTLLLAGLVGIGALSYAVGYPRSAATTDFAVFLCSVSLAQGIAFLNIPGNGNRGKIPDLAGSVVTLFLLLLGAATLFHPDMGVVYQYRERTRWSGPWINPNTYGQLMGLGTTMAVGMFCSAWLPSPSPDQAGSAESRRRFPLLFLVLIGVMGFGLAKSYSRGAWLGTLVGISYLVYSAWKHHGLTLARNWWPWRHLGILCLVAAGLLTLVFWNFRHTELLIVRRVLSVANKNDFSWKNRVVAYRGALQMMANKPLTGFGWGEPEIVYEDLYQPPDLAEGKALVLNDYFTLGMNLGLPALICFLGYIYLSFHPAAGAGQGSPAGDAAWPRAVCRAGVLLLLVGFCFERSLLSLALATPFWILLELGVGPRPRQILSD